MCWVSRAVIGVARERPRRLRADSTERLRRLHGFGSPGRLHESFRIRLFHGVDLDRLASDDALHLCVLALEPLEPGEIAWRSSRGTSTARAGSHWHECRAGEQVLQLAIRHRTRVRWRRSASRRSDSCATVDLLGSPFGRKSTAIPGPRFWADARPYIIPKSTRDARRIQPLRALRTNVIENAAASLVPSMCPAPLPSLRAPRQ